MNVNMKKVIIISSIFCCFVVFVGCGILFPKLKSEKLTCDNSGVTFYFPFYERIRYRTDSIGKLAVAIPIKPNDSLNLYQNYRFSKSLCMMGEPILYNKTNQAKNVIRFSHFGAWSSPYSFRIEQNKSKVSISFNKTQGHGNLGNRNIENGIIKRGIKNININDWKSVVSKMDSIDFWNMETHGIEILDGAEWVFEALINGRYHFVLRNTPEYYDGKEYAELCNLVMQIYIQVN